MNRWTTPGEIDRQIDKLKGNFSVNIMYKIGDKLGRSNNYWSG